MEGRIHQYLIYKLKMYRHNSYFFLFQAKIESDRVIGSVGKKVVQETGIKVRSRSHGLSMAHRKGFQQMLQGISEDVPHRLLDLNMKEYAGFQVALLNKVTAEHCFSCVVFLIEQVPVYVTEIQSVQASRGSFISLQKDTHGISYRNCILCE